MDFEERDARWRDVTIDVCPTCSGTWFDSGEIGRISKDKEVERLLVEYAGGPSTIKCPRDGAPMLRRPVDSVTLDVCPRCRGVWADAGELEVAARTFQGQGDEAAFRDGLPEDPVLGGRALLGRVSMARQMAFYTFRAPGLKMRLEQNRREHHDRTANRLDKM